MNLNRESLISLTLWLSLGTISVFLINYKNLYSPYKIAIVYLGILIITHGLLYFNRHGGNYFTPTGLYLLFSSLLVGFAAIYVNFQPSYVIIKGHYIGALSGFIIQVVTYFLFLDYNPKYKIVDNIKTLGTKVNRIWSLTFASLIIIVGIIISKLSKSFTFFEPGSIYVGLILLTISLILLNNKVNLKHIFIVFLFFLLYYIFIFDEFGRIKLVTLFLAIIIILSIRINIKRIKFIVSIMFYP